jgi:uncharacterized protein YjiS (DUF1127 family)
VSIAPILQTRASSRISPVNAETLSSLASRIVARVARELRIRRDMRRLAEMDDAMLRDIGLARTEIEPAVRHGRSFLEL